MPYTLQPPAHYRDRFDGSPRLFRACWRQYRAWMAEGAIDDPTTDQDVLDWLDSIAAERVNDGRSSFYIYG